jgi:glycerophosphoryl diester phosphodiesterase
MLKIAHRGYTKYNEDNSLNAFNDAVNYNFDMIELDIQLDKNNNIIIMHDSHINYSFIENMSYNEILKQYPKTLLLSTFFKKFNYSKIMLYFDLKGSDKLAEILHKFLKTNNINTKNIWFASFNINHIDILYNKNKNYNFGLITDNSFTLDIISYITEKYNIQFVCFHWSMLNKQTIQFLKEKKIKIFAYTLISNKQLPYIYKFNIDGIVSDILIKSEY